MSRSKLQQRYSTEGKRKYRQSLQDDISNFFEEGMPYTHLVLVTEKNSQEIVEELSHDFGCHGSGGTDREGLYAFVATESEARDIIEGLRKNYEKYRSKKQV